MTNNQNKPITFVLLDESITTYGIRILVDGVDINQFKRNPTMYYNHRDYELPIGRWTNIRKENGQILAEPDFDYNDSREEVQELFRKVQSDFVKMASVDLRDIEISTDAKYMLPGQKEPTIIKARLREASVVNNGGNHNAFKLFDATGSEIPLSDSIKLSDVFKPKQMYNMNKELLTKLQLSDDATPLQIEAKIQAVLTENETLKQDKNLLLTDKEALQSELDKIKLAESTKQKEAFSQELEMAFKDGRLDNDTEGNTRQNWLKLYDVAPDVTMNNLSGLPKRQSISQNMHQKGEGTSAWDQRMKEINDANKNK